MIQPLFVYLFFHSSAIEQKFGLTIPVFCIISFSMLCVNDFGLWSQDHISSCDLKVKSSISHYQCHRNKVFTKPYCKQISQKLIIVLSSCLCLLKISIKFIQSSFLYPGLTPMITEKLVSVESDNIQSKVANIFFIYFRYEN